MVSVANGFVVIGAQAVFFTITNLKTMHEVERGQLPVPIGEDIFATGTIQPPTVTAIATALHSVAQVFLDYGITQQVVVGSHSFFEAKNAQFVQDQLLSRTGWLIHRATLAQEAFYRIQAVFARFPNFAEVTKEGTVLIDISSGSVALTAFVDGQFGFSRNLSLGPLRVFEVMGDLKLPAEKAVAVMRDFIDSRLVDFMRLLPRGVTYTNMILMGSALSLFEHLIPEGQGTVQTDRAGFGLLYEEVARASGQYLMAQFDLPAQAVAQVLPTLLLVARLVRQLDSQVLWISNLKLIDGVAVATAYAAGYKPAPMDPDAAILISARNLAARYQVDAKHQQATVTFALQLFDRLKALHGLTKRDRLLLQVAATVNDIGSYIDTHRHYAHSDYLIQAADLMGLTATEQQMVATSARFHASDTPQIDLANLPLLAPKDRLRVAKLTALLRVADALDAARQQRIEKIRVSKKEDTVVLTATTRADIELERWTLAHKGAFFADVFGLAIILRGKRI